MARFASNPALAAGAARPTDATNAAGGRAFANDAKTSLAIQLVSSFASGDHYRDDAAQLQALRMAVEATKDLQWCAKAACYARDVMGMRTTSHFVTAVIASLSHGEPWLKKFYEDVVVRPDDMCEIIGALWLLKEKGAAIPNAMKRGFANRFKRFNGYAMAKYRGGGRAVKLVDVVRLCHPKGDLITQLCKGTLPPAETWEVGLSAARDAKARAAVWGDLLREDKLGYMATMRNLRNIAKDAPAALPAALAVIRDAKRRQAARVFPFRLYTAHKVMEAETEIPRNVLRDILDALGDALDDAASSVPRFEGSSLVVVDTSASMGSTVSAKSLVKCVEAGAVLGATLKRVTPASDLAQFADSAKYIRVHKGTPVIGIAEAVLGQIGHVGHGTNMSSILQLAGINEFQRIFVMTDSQSWYGDEGAMTRWLQGKKGRHVYVWNLHSDGTSQLDPRCPGLIQLGGFSDRIWDTIPMLETGPTGLVQAIDAWNPEAPKVVEDDAAGADPGA